MQDTKPSKQVKMGRIYKKKLLNRDIDLLVSFSKIRISNETVLCIKDMS